MIAVSVGDGLKPKVPPGSATFIAVPPSQVASIAKDGSSIANEVKVWTPVEGQAPVVVYSIV
jgi:hypothetical protein